MGDAARPASVTSLPRFLVPAGAATGRDVLLAAEQSKHARVRRLRIGDAVALFDGAGHSYRGTITQLSRAGVMVAIVEEFPPRSAESALDLTLALAAIKSDRFEWAVEKATELGIARLRPFVSKHSLARPAPSRQRRWEQIALAAAKQSGRSIVPVIADTVSFDDIIRDAGSRRVLCFEGACDPPPLSREENRHSLTVIVGPEGGFTEDEAERATHEGCELMSLGPRLLRAETAAIAAVVLCQATWGDLNGPRR